MRSVVKVPFIASMETTECGAACLAMILAKWGHWAPLNEVREICGVSRDGSSTKSIASAARAYGMQAEEVLADLAEFDQLPLPCILHVDFAHFIVMRGYSKDKVWFTDSTTGDSFMTMDAFSLRYTGVAVVMLPGDDFQEKPRQNTFLRQVKGLMQGAGVFLVGIAWLTAIAQGFAMAIPFLNRFLIDRVIPTGNYSSLLWAGGLGLGAFLLMSGTEAIRGLIIREMRTRLDLAMMRNLADQLFRLPVGFFLRRAQGVIANKMAFASNIRSTIGERVVSTLFDAATALAFMLVLARYTLLGAGLAIVYACFFSLFQRLMVRRLWSLYQSRMAASGAAYGVLMESQHAIETVKAMGAEQRVFDQWCGHATAEAKDEVWIGNIHATNQAILQAAGEGFIMAVMGLAGAGLVRGSMTVGEFAAVLVAARSLTIAVSSFSGAFRTMSQTGAFLNTLSDITDAVPERVGGIQPHHLEGGFKIEGLCFSYGNLAPNVIEDVTLDIQPGEMVGIVGPSGSGKSTLVKIIAGLFQAKSGRVLVDGTDLAEIDLAWLRAHIGFVLQESFVFNDTIGFNITLGSPVDPEALDEACRIAGLLEKVRTLPQGYDTVVGEGGRILSGGQRQRLTLARALYKKPKILILDEASSALDIETEKLVHQALLGLNCTRIVIAHRLETVKAANRIVQIEGGRVSGIGTFHDLAAANPRFMEMCVASGAIGGGL